MYPYVKNMMLLSSKVGLDLTNLLRNSSSWINKVRNHGIYNHQSWFVSSEKERKRWSLHCKPTAYVRRNKHDDRRSPSCGIDSILPTEEDDNIGSNDTIEEPRLWGTKTSLSYISQAESISIGNTHLRHFPIYCPLQFLDRSSTNSFNLSTSVPIRSCSSQDGRYWERSCVCVWCPWLLSM